MTTFYKKPGDGAVICGACRNENDHLVVELDPALFPDTYDRLFCGCCGVSGKVEAPPGRDSPSARPCPGAASWP